MKQAIRIILCSILCVIANTACRKANDAIPPPVPEEFDVITTGSIYNENNQVYEAYYWKNTERVALPAPDTRQAFAYGLDKVASTLYVAGGYEGEHPVSGVTMLLPCYWKDGQKINLPVEGLDITQRCGAADIRLVNDVLYVLGDVDERPVLWKIANGQTMLIEFPLNDTVTDLRRAPNLQLHEGKIFVGGNQKIKRGNLEYFNAGYWVIGQNDQPVFYTIESQLAYALCFATTVSAQGIFITGEYHETATTSAKPAIWSSQGRLPVAETLHPSYNRLRAIVTSKGGTLYTILHDIQRYQPVLWKLSGTHNVEVIKPPVPDNAKGLCKTIDVYEENLAYSYIYQQENTWKGFYVFRGKTQELNIDNNRFASFNRTRIFLR